MLRQIKFFYRYLVRKKKLLKLNNENILIDNSSNNFSKSNNKGRKILCLYFDGLPSKPMELYGGYVPTPNFNRLASSGTNYHNMIVPAPSSAMCITSMFTGLFPHQFGRRSFSNEDKGLPKDCKPLLNTLQEDGYELFFLWDESFMDRRSQNKYKILNWKNYDINFLDIADKDIQAVQTKKLLSEIDSKYDNWFCYVRFSDGASSKYKGSAKNHSPYTFDDEIIEADVILGDLLDSISDDIEIIVFSDHGKSYGEHGIYKYAFNLSEMSLNVPFITSWGGGQNETNLVSMVDFPSIIMKEDLTNHRYIYADTGYADQWIRSTMVRKGRWKYVYNRTGWRFPEELYDLKFDPNELINLVGKHRDPYRDSRPKGDTVDIKNSPSAEVLDGKDVSEIYPRNDWNRVKRVLKELRLERQRIWEIQGVDERKYE